MIPKFRVWEPDTKFMNNQVRITWNRFGSGELWVEATDAFGWVEVDSKYLMQYTEFKNDKDIFVAEGDIVNIHWFYTDFDRQTLGVIEGEATAKKVVITKEYGNLGFWWEDADTWVELSTLAMSVQLHDESFDVLGNIWENSELLEDQK